MIYNLSACSGAGDKGYKQRQRAAMCGIPDKNGAMAIKEKEHHEISGLVSMYQWL
jgi:hypothetical protein